MQIGENGCQVSSAFYGRSGADLDADSHLSSDDIGQGSLAQTGRTIEDDVIKRLAPLLSGDNSDPQIVLESLLTDKVGKALGAQVEVNGAIFSCCFA